MFHDRKRSKTNMGENENPKPSKSSSSKRKSKHSTSKKKKWDVKLNKTALNHGSYESDLVGTKRLTKRLGILAKGKISDSISRLEKTMPNGLKFQTDQDLHRILHESDLHVTSQNDSVEYANQSNNCFLNDSPDVSPVVKPPSVNKDDFEYSLRTQDSKFSSVSNSSNAETDSDISDLLICKKMVSNMHLFSEKVNKELYPEVSNLKRAKKEFLDVKNEYRASRATLSSSNNCESSQENFLNENSQVLTKENFKLNPVLTQETSVANDLESLFPSSRENSTSSSDSDVEILEEPEMQPVSDSDYCGNRNKSYESSQSLPVNVPCRAYSQLYHPSLMRCSPDSSSDSPVFKPDVSPVKFIPEYRPSPKLYYRQKMF